MRDEHAAAVESETELPRVGGLGLLLWYGVIGVFVSLAVRHLVHWKSIVLPTLAASVLWLALVVGMTAHCVREDGGLTQYLINRFGMLGWKRFLSVERNSSGELQACFGYRVCDRRFYLLKVLLREIISVGWSTGQATGLVGRDMNDWQTRIWYFSNRVTMISPLTLRESGRFEDAHFFGPYADKATVDAFGTSVVKFLCDAGATLAPSASRANEFVNPTLVPVDPASS